MFTSDQLLRRGQVYALTGMTRYMLDMLENAGDFPKRMRVGQRAVFWSAAEIAEYIEKTKSNRALGIDPEGRS